MNRLLVIFLLIGLTVFASAHTGQEYSIQSNNLDSTFEGCSLESGCAGESTFLDTLVLNQSLKSRLFAPGVGFIASVFSFGLLFGLLNWKPVPAVAISFLILTISLLVPVVQSFNDPVIDGCVATMPDGTIAAHCHFDLFIDVCGEPSLLDDYHGQINKIHTHSGSTRVHYHPSGWLSDLSGNTLRSVAEDLGFELSETSVRDHSSEKVYANGSNVCGNNTPDELKVLVDGERVSDFLDLVIADEAEVRIVFD